MSFLKKIAFSLCIGLFTMSTIFAQNASDAKNKAKTILDKVSKTYKTYKTMEADFTLTIEMAESGKEVQKGKMIQSDNKYKISMGGQEIISDGKSTWIYLKKNNEVQINNANSGDDDVLVSSPKDLLKIYEKGGFEYFFNGEGTENGKAVSFIEVKPLDRAADYSKLRLSIEKSTNKILAIKTFNKDGSKFTVAIGTFATNKSYAANTFSFDAKKYPNVHVEDLRTN